MTPLVLALPAFLLAAWEDGRTRRIPDSCSLWVAGCALLRILLSGQWQQPLLGLTLLGGFLLIWGLWCPQVVGGGDIKLCAALGLLLGYLPASLTLIAACLLGIGYCGIRGQRTFPLALPLLPAYLLTLSILIIRS